MEEQEARTQAELEAVLSVLTELTGLPSRWSGRVELVPNAEFKGRKPFRCDIEIDAALAQQDERWPTLIHESLHSISAGYNGSDFRQLRGWEEGVVEQLQRVFRPVILGKLGINVANTVFHPGEETHPFNGYIAAIESLRLILNANTTAHADQQDFYLDLLAVPIRDRPDSVLRVGFALEQPQRGIFISTFSRANSLLKLRAI